jgi:hypothetical protein
MHKFAVVLAALCRQLRQQPTAGNSDAGEHIDATAVSGKEDNTTP